jgi:hypothetical protein
MTDATEWLSLPHEGYCASDSLLQLVAFGLREGAEAVETGPAVPFLVFRRGGRIALTPLYSEPGQDPPSVRSTLAEQPEPVTECAFVSYGSRSRDGIRSVVVVASSEGHGSSIVFQQDHDRPPTYLGRTEPVLPGWQGPRDDSGIPTCTAGMVWHSTLFLPAHSEATLHSVSAVLSQARESMLDDYVVRENALARIFQYDTTEHTLTLTEERTRLLVHFDSWSCQIGVVTSTRWREEVTVYSQLVERGSGDLVRAEKIAAAGPLRVEVWTDRDPERKRKHEFGAVLHVLTTGLDAGGVFWGPPKGPSPT